MSTLSGKVSIVTGAGKGSGQGIALALVQPAMRCPTGATIPLDGGQADFG